MRSEFWLERWRSGQIGWHQVDVNRWLAKHWPALGLDSDCPVFVPLCGKSLDMAWLRALGHRVIGVELAEVAVRSFFEEAGTPFKVFNTPGDMPRFSSGGIHIYCGDYLELSAAHLEAAPGAFDRGALVALPAEQRAVYADHVQRILPVGAQVLLITLDYDQERAPGPPFAVSEAEVPALYGTRCRIRQLDSSRTGELPPHFLECGIEVAEEGIYLVTKLD
ncbi:MAG: thiopurine S-methyltransferase [Gammaproteobacteria bacterium]|nr:thiopurine S-methyltransferase [Gammaproteobacteria bacterium]